MKPARPAALPPAALPPAPPPPAGTRGGGAHGLPEGAPVPIAQSPRPPAPRHAPGPGGGPTHPTLEPRLGFCRMGRWHRLQAVLPLRASQRAFPFPRLTKAVLGENSENTIGLSATWTARPEAALLLPQGARGAGRGAGRGTHCYYYYYYYYRPASGEEREAPRGSAASQVVSGGWGPNVNPDPAVRVQCVPPLGLYRIPQ